MRRRCGGCLPTLLHVLKARLARYIELAVRLNIEDRQVRITERDAALLLRAQVGALRTMGLDDDQIDEFRARFARILREGE